MKTNANLKSITKAVKAVSQKYDNNIILLREPENTTKNVIRFVVKAKDKNKAGAFILKNGVKTSKANESVQLDIIDEIFNIETNSHIYVDTHVGRIWKDDRDKEKIIVEMPEVEEVKAKTPIETVKKEDALAPQNLLKLAKPYEKVTKRKYNSRKARMAIESKTSNESIEKIMKALNYILKHEEILEKI